MEILVLGMLVVLLLWSSVFSGAALFDQDISAWDVSSVTNMAAMFSGAALFDQDISAWDVSSVTNMAAMFKDATTFNQDLSSWCVKKITTSPDNFNANSGLQLDNLPIWGDCNATWTGTTNNEWDTATNWNPSIVPNTSMDITIPSGLTNYPTATSDVSFDTMTLKNGATFIPKSSTSSSSSLEIIDSNNIGSSVKAQISNGISDNTETGIVFIGDTHIIVDLNGSATNEKIASGTTLKIYVTKNNTAAKQLKVSQSIYSNSTSPPYLNQVTIDESDLSATHSGTSTDPVESIEYTLNADTEYLLIKMENRVGGNFKIKEIEIVTNTVTGDITYERNLPNTDWYLISSPVSGESMEDVISNHSLAIGVEDPDNRGLASFVNTDSNPWNYKSATSTGALNEHKDIL